MKKQMLLLFAIILSMLQIQAQTGLDCNNAVTISQPSSQVQTSGVNQHWYKFIATATTAKYEVTQNASQKNLYKIELYAGSCSSLTVLDEDSIISNIDSTATVGNLYLTIGTTYYLRVVFINNNQNYAYSTNLSTLLATPPIIIWTNPNGSSGFCGGINGAVCSTTVCVGESMCFSYNIQYPQSGTINYSNYATNHVTLPFSDGGSIVVENTQYIGANPTGCVNYTFNNVGTVTTSTAVGVTSYQFSITVIPANTPPLYSVNQSTNVCLGECVTFTPLNSSQNISVISNDPYTPCTTGTPPQAIPNTYIFTNTGINTILYTINGGSSCTETFSIPIVVSAPVIVVTNTLIPCTLNGIFNANLNCNNTPSFTWNIYTSTNTVTPLFSDNNAYNNTINYTFPVAGTYVIEVYYYQNSVIVATTIQTITISPTTPPTLVLTPTTQSICTGSSASINASGASNYTWSNGATTPNITVSPTVTTVYAVTGVNSCSLSATAFATVFVYPPQNPITATASPNPICANQTATLQASGANSYTWAGIGSGNTIVVTPSVTTTYTVFGSNGICASTQSAVVTVSVLINNVVPFTITTTNTTICASGTGTNVVPFGTTLTNTVGLTFGWNNGAGTAVTNYSITQPQIISVTVNDACQNTSTQTLAVNYVAPACCTFTNVLTSYTVTGPITISNQTFRIGANQILTIVGNVTYNNCNFLMGTNAVIIEKPNAVLKLVNSKLYSCEGMWQGIVLANNSNQSAQIFMDNSNLEDAYYGIYSNHPLSLYTQPNLISVTNTSVLNKNYNDIVITYTNSYSTVGLVTPLKVENSRMQSQSSATSPGVNFKISNYYTPSIRNHGYAGLYMDNAGVITFTYATGGNNLVRNKDYGLVFRKTDADVYNVDFKDMIKGPPTGTVIPFPLGVAILSNNAPNYLNVKPAGTSTITNTTFNNIAYGIIATKTPTVDVQRCDFNNPLQSTGLYGDFGISAVDANSLLRMNYNTMTRVLYGCTVNYSVIPTATSYSMSVSNNTISAGNGQLKTAVTINAATSSPGLLGSMVVAANAINKAEFGVFATNIQNSMRISGNIITLAIPTGTNFCEGVALGGCNGLMVDGNNINGLQLPLLNPNTYNVNSIGIGSGFSPNCFIRCNTITRVGTGIAYFGNNTSVGAGFFGNTFNSPIKRGFALIAGGIVGTQGIVTAASGNVWNGFAPLVSDQTMVGVSGAPSFSNLSKLYVHNNALEYPMDNQSTLPSLPTAVYAIPFGSLILVPNSLPNITTCAPTLTAGYRVILTPTTSITLRNADYSNYITTVLTATSPATPQQKLTLKQQMHKNIRKTSVGANATVANFYTTQQSAEVAKYYEVDSLIGEGNVALAQAKNNSATASNNITQNHKDFNNIYLNGVATPSDYATLQALANKCAYEDGNAVYQARALLNMIDYTNTIYIDNCDGTNEGARMGYFDDGEQQGVAVAQNIQANLFPNPNNGEFTLAYDLKNVVDATVIITDVTGKIVYNSVITNENNLVKIQTDNLNSGLYFIQLSNNGALLWTNKVMINN